MTYPAVTQRFNWNLSFEFFPPKTAEGAAKLVAVREQLYRLQPQFCSVTYGAGGSTQEGTLHTVQAILKEGMEAAPHFSCIGAEADLIRAQLQAFKLAGICRIVALRGDLPSGYGGFGEFRYASDLVAFIRHETGDYFHIEVAAYPEMHPQAKSPQADLQAFVTKVKAGADAAITQMIFNCDAYLRFVEEAQGQGVMIPIVPGIMPITNATGIVRFAENCGADIPRWIRLRLASYGDDVASIKAFGQEVITRLCEQLLANGAPGLHFYTMNQTEPNAAIVKHLQRATA
jgi:methylenetetrahydrofolate reductase (NADPH)